MARRQDPSHPGYARPADIPGGGYTAGSGRRPGLKEPSYGTLRAYGVDVAGRTIDLASLPLVDAPAGGGAPRLDTARVAADLARTGPDAHHLSTVAVRDAAACAMYDIAVNEAGLGPGALSGGDVARVAAGMPALVGRLMPVFGQVRPPKPPPPPRDDDGRAPRARPRVADLAFEPVRPLEPDGALPPAHAFALRPVQLSTVAPDQGRFLCGGVMVSNRCYNFPEGDDRRVRTGRHPAFEESVSWMLVTHAYPADLTYAAVNPPGVVKRRRDGAVRVLDGPGRNVHEAVFRWRAAMERQAADLGDPRAGVSTFGFTDLKQTGKDVMRRMLPWPVRDIADRLAQARAVEGGLDAFLLELPMVVAGNAADSAADLKNRAHGGLDLRRMLLVEMLLRGTPLAGLLDGSPPELPPGPAVPGGARGLYDRMKAFCDANLAADDVAA